MIQHWILTDKIDCYLWIASVFSGFFTPWLNAIAPNVAMLSQIPLWAKKIHTSGRFLWAVLIQNHANLIYTYFLRKFYIELTKVVSFWKLFRNWKLLYGYTTFKMLTFYGIKDSNADGMLNSNDIGNAEYLLPTAFQAFWHDLSIIIQKYHQPYYLLVKLYFA